MSAIDWWKVKPSSSPPLAWAEVLALPDGTVIFEGGIPLMLTGGEPGERRARIWQSPTLGVGGEPGSWSASFTYLFMDGKQLRLPKLPRLSFALTTDAIRRRQKTVTRRLAKPSWWKEGAWFLGVDKIRQAGAQGLCIGRCGKANREPLAAISQSEVDREGFPHTTPEGFCAMFRRTAPREWDGWVWRLPFSYLEIPT